MLVSKHLDTYTQIERMNRPKNKNKRENPTLLYTLFLRSFRKILPEGDLGTESTK